MSPDNRQRYVSKDVSPAPLGKPLQFEFSGREAKNRFLKAAMTGKSQVLNDLKVILPFLT